jgi:trehalose utilization protein
MRVIVWSDDLEGARLTPDARRVHPDGIAATLAEVVVERLPGATVSTTGLGNKHDGLPESALAVADAVVWWGHKAHSEVSDATVRRVSRRIREGLGLIVLHSAHHSKIFRGVLGTTCDLRWVEPSGEEEVIWTVDPSHPVAAGVEQPIRLAPHELYSEPFDIPNPEPLVFVSSFPSGRVFRSGCCFRHGAGRIFFFGPGHESYPVYQHPQVRRVIGNAIEWAARSR